MSAEERSLYDLRKGRLASDQFCYLLSLLKSVFLQGSQLLVNYGLMATYQLSTPFPFCRLGHLGLFERWTPALSYFICTHMYAHVEGREQLAGVNAFLPPRGSWGLTPSSVLVASTFASWAILSVFHGWIHELFYGQWEMNSILYKSRKCA